MWLTHETVSPFKLEQQEAEGQNDLKSCIGIICIGRRRSAEKCEHEEQPGNGQQKQSSNESPRGRRRQEMAEEVTQRDEQPKKKQENMDHREKRNDERERQKSPIAPGERASD